MTNERRYQREYMRRRRKEAAFRLKEKVAAVRRARVSSPQRSLK